MVRIAIFAAIVGAAAWGSTLPELSTGAPANVAHPPRPGSINYVEGVAYLEMTPLDASCVGTLEMLPGQVVTTEAGKVEILLTPGVFLRVADNSAVRMISPDLAKTEVEIDKGRVLIEGVDIRTENDIEVDLNGAKIKLVKSGLYDFDFARNEVRVFHGTAEVAFEAKTMKVETGEKLALASGHLKPQHFDERPFEDEFYRWNGLRSGYLSEASVSEARAYIGKGPGWYAEGWLGLGWYWNPWFGVYTFLPMDGVYYGPFGWGFYSPIEVFRSPFVFYGNYPHSFAEFHYPYGHGFPEPAGRGGRIGR